MKFSVLIQQGKWNLHGLNIIHRHIQPTLRYSKHSPMCYDFNVIGEDHISFLVYTLTHCFPVLYNFTSCFVITELELWFNGKCHVYPNEKVFIPEFLFTFYTRNKYQWGSHYYLLIYFNFHISIYIYNLQKNMVRGNKYNNICMKW